jgi:rubredoxin
MITYECKNGHKWDRYKTSVFCPECGLIACAVTEIEKMAIREFEEVYGVTVKEESK